MLLGRKSTRDKQRAVCSIPGCGRQSTAHGWCQKHYMRVRQRGKVDLTEPAKTPIERLLKGLHYEPNTGCWLRPQSQSQWGHSLIRHEGKNIYAHRLSWILHKGPVPHGLCVLHKCDNPPCVNPEHLFLGTLQDNTQDAMRKGRIKIIGNRFQPM